MNPKPVLSTYSGYLTKGGERRNFEVSARSKNEARRILNKQRPGCIVVFREKHPSVYEGRMGHPRIKHLRGR